ncbi:tyrosine-protein kinase family protein [Psychromonas sp. KJ10-10]|uniref:tyrosine-protein kinase family protein n=1 Tax=Psychromonas sp. KJ10-10 TaxID=3391823 RepID=UPI0039B54D15
MTNIPYQNMEIEQVYTQVLNRQGKAIAVCSANSGEGVTSLALALAQRNLLAGHSTLLVDLNLYRPALHNLLPIKPCSELSSLSGNKVLPSPQLVTIDNNPITLTGISAPTKREDIIKLRQPGVLEQCISEWLEDFDTVIFDTSPLNRINGQNIPAERIASACDGAILTVLAGQTNETMVTSAVNKLQSNHVDLLGCVFNDYNNPSLKNELLREVQKLESKCAWLSRYLKRLINNNNFLKLEI